jgi:hypothetical protein
MAYNVSAVHEAPELTARSAEEFPRPSKATAFMGCVAGARKRAVRDTQPVMCFDSRLFHGLDACMARYLKTGLVICTMNPFGSP